MAQKTPERQNNNRVHDHPILSALIGAVAVIAAATITAVFTHGGSGGGGTQPSPSSPAQTDQSVKPTPQTTILLLPSAEPVSNWISYGPDVNGFTIQKSGNDLLINTPSSYYKRMLGAFSVQGNVCDFDLKFEASVTGDTASSGYGYSIAPRADLVNGVPSGWSLQVEWDGTKGGYYYRHVILPQQASQPTDDFYLGPSNLGKIYWDIKADGSQINVSINGKAIPWDPQYPTAACGNGLAFRVWGGSATFTNINLAQSPT
jgi:hypothetical protein